MQPVFTLAETSDADQLIELMREFYAVEHLGLTKEWRARR
jgi:hypothetical protein